MDHLFGDLFYTLIFLINLLIPFVKMLNTAMLL